MPFTIGNTIRNTGKTRFKKGDKPWNLGLKIRTNTGKTLFKKGDECLQNENHHNWKGENVGYVGLHTWVRRKRGKPVKCEFCNSKKNIQWANKSHEYHRDLDDWIALCRPCHMKYDGMVEKANNTIRKRYEYTNL